MSQFDSRRMAQAREESAKLKDLADLESQVQTGDTSPPPVPQLPDLPPVAALPAGSQPPLAPLPPHLSPTPAYPSAPPVHSSAPTGPLPPHLNPASAVAAQPQLAPPGWPLPINAPAAPEPALSQAVLPAANYYPARRPDAKPVAAPTTAQLPAKDQPVSSVRSAPPQSPTTGLLPTVAAADAKQEEPSSDLTGVAIRSAPPWLISMCVHIVLVVVLALINLPQMLKSDFVIEASYAESLGDQLLDDSISATSLDTLQNANPVLSQDLNPVEDPLAAVPEMPIQLQGATSIPNLQAPSIGIALTGREQGAKKALLAAYGGTALTEDSVRLALQWLRRNQNRDGSWSLMGPYSEGATLENKTAATAMALLAFQGNGQTHQSGEYKDVVNKGIQFLLKSQDADGLFFHEGVSNHRMYSQAMATIVICELYGMTKDDAMQKPAQRALNYAAKVQADDGQGGGGWRYQPGKDVDTSVTGWFVMAFQSARMGGLEGYSPVLERVSTYLDHVEQVTVDEQELDAAKQLKDIVYYYRLDEIVRPPTTGTPALSKSGPTLTKANSMTAEALLCRQYLGWQRRDPRMKKGAEKILINSINWDEPNFYYWYYATQVMHHLGGDDWFAWNRGMREAIPKAQVKTGKEAGSWSPAGDPYGYQGGRLYATCFCTYLLEVYYRHLPIYRH